MKKRLLNGLVIGAFCVVVVLFGAFLVWEHVRANNTVPQLSCDSDTLQVSIHATTEDLLAGVSATDAEDGDLTGSVVVESISHFIEKGVCHITYAVQDSANAVAKLTRTLIYTDYTSPRFALTAPLVFDYGKSFDPTSVVQATDCIDGDITGSVRMTLMEDDATISGVGRWQVRFRVTNSMGETAYLTTYVTVTDQSTMEKNYSPGIRLKQYIAYVDEGEPFDPKSYVSGVSIAAEGAVDNPIQLESKLRVQSEVDTSVPGTYTVTYSCTASNGYTGSAELIVVVGGKSE